MDSPVLQEAGLKNVQRAAVGRAARLGDLYDIHSDRFCHGSILKVPAVDELITVAKCISRVSVVKSDSFAEKCTALGIDEELGLSILAGICPVSGCAKYLKTTKTSVGTVQNAVVHTTETANHRLDVNSEGFSSCMIGNLGHPSATHAVVGITFGATSVLMLTHSGGDVTQLARTADLTLQAIAASVKGYTDVVLDEEPGLSYELFSDVLNPREVTNRLRDVVAAVRHVGARIAATTEDKRLTYLLMPLANLRERLDLDWQLNPVMISVDSGTRFQVLDIYERMTLARQRYNDLTEIISTQAHCEIGSLAEVVKHHGVNIRRIIAFLQGGLSSALPLVRSEAAIKGWAGKVLYTPLLTECAKMDKELSEIFARVDGKVRFVKRLLDAGAEYVSDGKSFERAKEMAKDRRLYILFFSLVSAPSASGEEGGEEEDVKEDAHEMAANRSFFLRLMKRERHNPSVAFAAVDLDVNIPTAYRPYESEIWSVCRNETQVCERTGQQYVWVGLHNEPSHLSPHRLGYVDQQHVTAASKPYTRVPWEAPCPTRLCQKGLWYCARCGERLEYDFNRSLHCDCGAAALQHFRFMCCSKSEVPGNADAFQEYTEALAPPKELNYLLLGATGIGKTTWIDSIPNYLSHPSYDMALDGCRHQLAPLSGRLTASTGEKENEPLPETPIRGPKSYELRSSGLIARFIDTPGLGQSIAEDEENMATTLRFLTTIEQLHAIVIFLKPDSCENSLKFKFLLKEILIHLHRDALPNIVFCFTHTRPADFQPGKTEAALIQVLEETKCDILVDPQTVYCIDNEAFVRFRDENYLKLSKRDLHDSWHRSREEIVRLMENVKNHKRTHRVRDTVGLNDTRKLILSLANLVTPVGSYVPKLAEEKVVQNALSHLGAFLRDSAVAPYNNVLGDYLDRLIAEERHNISRGDCTTTELLLRLRAQFAEQQKILRHAIKSDQTRVTASDLGGFIDSLYGLTGHGALLTDALRSSLTANRPMPRMTEGGEVFIQCAF